MRKMAIILFNLVINFFLWIYWTYLIYLSYSNNETLILVNFNQYHEMQFEMFLMPFMVMISFMGLIIYLKSDKQ